MESILQTFKCVVVGDAAVGKTCLLLSYRTNRFPSQFVPNTCDNYAVRVMFKEDPYTFSLFDTPAGLFYSGSYASHLKGVLSDRRTTTVLRPLSYEQTDIFLVCFNVACPASFANAKEKWFPEVMHHCPGVPCLLVGLQIDLRDDPIVTEKLDSQQQGVVTSEQGERLAREVGAHRYVECSALTRKGLKEVFDWALYEAAGPPIVCYGPRPRCVVV